MSSMSLKTMHGVAVSDIASNPDAAPTVHALIGYGGTQERVSKWLGGSREQQASGCPSSDPFLILLRYANMHWCVSEHASEARASEPQIRAFARRIIEHGFPRSFQKGDSMVEEIERVEKSRLSEYLSLAWDQLESSEQRTLVDRFNARVTKALLGSGPLEARTREVVLAHVAAIAEEEVGRRVEEIRARVVQEVESRWAEVVEGIVARRLAEAVAKIKAEMLK